MALTVAIQHRTQPRGARINTALVTFDSSYPTGGEAITANQLGLTTISTMVVSGGGQGYIVQYDRTSTTGGNLMAFSSAATQVADTTNLATVTVEVIAVGY